MMWHVYLKCNEYTGWPANHGEILVADFDKRRDALSYVKRSGYVAELGGGMQGRAKWQACDRIEGVA